MATVCPSCQQPVTATAAGFCPACAFPIAATPVAVAPPLTQGLAARQLELAAALDRSGSGAQFQQGVQTALAALLRGLAAAMPVRCWLQTHSDLDYQENEVLVTDGGTVDEALAEAGRVVFDGGGDAHESHLDAVEKLAALVPWTLDPTRARGVLLLIATAESKLPRSGHTPRQIGEDIRRRGLLFYALCQPTPLLYELTRAAGGLMFEISTAPAAGELQRIALAVQGSVQASVQAGATVPMVTP